MTVADHQIEFDTAERERIRAALRRRYILPELAEALGVELPALEAFTSGRAHLAPALLAAIGKILARSPAANIPAPASTRNTAMKLSARALKVTLLLDAGELAALPDPTTSRVPLQIAVAGGRTVSADIAAKALRKCKATIAEAGADQVTLLIQGKLSADDVITEAGLVAQPKQPKAAGS